MRIVSLVINTDTGDAEVCYRIDIADEYRWYPKLGGIDGIMATYEKLGVGTGYDIRGSSSVRCEKFNINNKHPDPRFGNQPITFGLEGVVRAIFQ